MASFQRPWLAVILVVSVFSKTYGQVQIQPGGILIGNLESSTLSTTTSHPLTTAQSTSTQAIESSSLPPSESSITNSSPLVVESSSSAGQRMLLPEDGSTTTAHTPVLELENVTIILPLATQTMLPLGNITDILLPLETETMSPSTINVTEPTTTIDITLEPIEHVTVDGRPQIASGFDCSGLEPGFYGNPSQTCDTKFYVCVDRSVAGYLFRCPARLYYDAEIQHCEAWLNIPACSGKPRPTMQVWNETQFVLPTAAPVIDCHNKTDGSYPDPVSTPKAFCSNRFFTCAGRREFRFFCPRGLYYDHERNTCDSFDRVFACSGNRIVGSGVPTTPHPTLPHVNFDCRGKPDGYYNDKCDSIYYSCNGGLARQFLCPDGLVFDSEWLSCESPYNTLVCTGSRRPSTVRPITTPLVPVVTTPSPMKCRGMPDGIYRDPEVTCSRFFYYCAHNDSFRNLCPGNLYYDAEVKQCKLWIDIFDCSGLRPTSTVWRSTIKPTPFPAVNFDCTRRADGNYINPNNSCSHFFYICANMEAFQQFCPAGLYYNSESNSCDAWSDIYACSGVSRKPTPATIWTPGPTEKPEFDCSLKDDGIYMQAVNGCSGVYFRCVAGTTFKFLCPGGLFYDVVGDRCNVFEYVFACSGRTQPPTAPPTTRAPTMPTPTPPIDCKLLPDGDYADPSAKNKCSKTYYSCTSGYALRRECSGGTYYDVDWQICDVYWHVPACTGTPRPRTVSVPLTTRAPPPALPFDCTKLYDGNYPSTNCSEGFWSCVGGLTFQRRCPVGFVYDDEFDGCEYPFMVPKCGGVRITTARPVATQSTTPVGGFDCQFLADGNYVDPAASDRCSLIYYTCANGLTTQVHCPDGLFYDEVNNTCDSHDLVPACRGLILRPVTALPSAIPTSMLPTNAPVIVERSTPGVPVIPPVEQSTMRPLIIETSSTAVPTEQPTSTSSSSSPTTESSALPSIASSSRSPIFVEPTIETEPTVPTISIEPTVPTISIEPTVPTIFIEPTVPTIFIEPTVPTTFIEPTMETEPTVPTIFVEPTIETEPTMPTLLVSSTIETSTVIPSSSSSSSTTSTNTPMILIPESSSSLSPSPSPSPSTLSSTESSTSTSTPASTSESTSASTSTETSTSTSTAARPTLPEILMSETPAILETSTSTEAPTTEIDWAIRNVTDIFYHNITDIIYKTVTEVIDRTVTQIVGRTVTDRFGRTVTVPATTSTTLAGNLNKEPTAQPTDGLHLNDTVMPEHLGSTTEPPIQFAFEDTSTTHNNVMAEENTTHAPGMENHSEMNTGPTVSGNNQQLETSSHLAEDTWHPNTEISWENHLNGTLPPGAIN